MPEAWPSLTSLGPAPRLRRWSGKSPHRGSRLSSSGGTARGLNLRTPRDEIVWTEDGGSFDYVRKTLVESAGTWRRRVSWRAGRTSNRLRPSQGGRARHRTSRESACRTTGHMATPRRPRDSLRQAIGPPASPARTAVVGRAPLSTVRTPPFGTASIARSQKVSRTSRTPGSGTSSMTGRMHERTAGVTCSRAEHSPALPLSIGTYVNGFAQRTQHQPIDVPLTPTRV